MRFFKWAATLVPPFCLTLRLGRSGAVLEPPAVVAGLDDVAVVGEPVEQRRGHLGVAEDAGPFAEGQVGGDDHRGALVELADQVEQQLAAGLGERQIAEFVEDDEVQARELARRAGPGLPARASSSSRLTRSTVLKKRPRAPARMQRWR